MLRDSAFEHAQLPLSNQIASISNKIYYLVMLISEGMTRPRNARNMLYTRNSHELAMFVAR